MSQFVCRVALWVQLGVILDKMADTIVYLTEGAVKGATLPCHIVEDNSSDDLQRVENESL